MRRNILLHLLLSSLITFTSLSTRATDQGHGSISMQGSIVDTACAIEAGGEDQTIDIGTVPISQLLHDGQGAEIPFQVHLINCSLDGDARRHTHWKDVHIVFDGGNEGGNLFALYGSGRGEALIITDAGGSRAVPGEPMPDTPLVPGNMALTYHMRVVSDRQPLRPGTFHTTVRYFMEYD